MLRYIIIVILGMLLERRVEDCNRVAPDYANFLAFRFNIGNTDPGQPWTLFHRVDQRDVEEGGAK